MTIIWILGLREHSLSQVCQSGDLLRQLVRALMRVVLLLRDTLELLDLSGHSSQIAEQYCQGLPWFQYDSLKVLFEADGQAKLAGPVPALNGLLSMTSETLLT